MVGAVDFSFRRFLFFTTPFRFISHFWMTVNEYGGKTQLPTRVLFSFSLLSRRGIFAAEALYESTSKTTLYGNLILNKQFCRVIHNFRLGSSCMHLADKRAFYSSIYSYQVERTFITIMSLFLALRVVKYVKLCSNGQWKGNQFRRAGYGKINLSVEQIDLILLS